VQHQPLTRTQFGVGNNGKATNDKRQARHGLHDFNKQNVNRNALIHGKTNHTNLQTRINYCIMSIELIIGQLICCTAVMFRWYKQVQALLQ
jgi:hypothetical protein